MIQRIVLVLCFIPMILTLVSCSGLRTRSDIEAERQSQQMEKHVLKPKASQEQAAIGTEESIPDEIPPPVVPVEKSSIQPPKVGVILGPGGVKTFAHSGVLKALKEARVPVEHVIGLGWGAMVGAMYAHKEQIHDVDWKLYKFKKEDFMGRSFFSSKFKANPISQIGPVLTENFGEGTLSQGAIPFSCPSLSIKTGRISWQDRGTYKNVLEKCMPYPPIFKPNGPWVAANFALQDAIQYLNRRDVEVIVLVNVLGKGKIFEQNEIADNYTSSLLWQELRRYMNRNRNLKVELVNVNTSKYSVTDFDSRKSIMSLGSRAGQRRAPMIAEKYGF